ncbi:hypothetical protein Psuf_063920 [Phytohabitans suffuscus]|uniref:Primosomal protein N' 3' DNA-binding domain-containing protein n=1 Tax=Phytohabitans suffuscus TaxID=624315 RepID=A0A6F8YSP4_9ACTN|nr:hypothetical protein Psuf_063920 [Phytohabitans suffuscus]
MDVPLAHLDRPFDYLVPDQLDEGAQPGTRVKVRFSGQLVDGWLLERAEETALEKKLLYVEKLVSPEVVLTPEVARLARAVADRYAGNLADVLRLAVPPRHARVEQAPAVEEPADLPDVKLDESGWSAYGATGFLAALTEGRPARAVWSALPGEDWPARFAEAAAATVRAGRGAVAVVADARDLDRLDAALSAVLGPGRHVALSAALGPAKRYRAFLAASRGRVPVVVGTRAAMFAPVTDLGLVALWDDGDDLHADPRAPYPHAREVLLTRAQLTGAGALLGGYARTGEAQLLLETGWAKEIVAPRETARARTPRSAPPATTRSWPATRRPRRRGCHRSPGRPPGRRSRAARRCWYRSRAAATCRRWRAPDAAPPRAARTAPARWHCARHTPCPAASGAAASPPRTPARPAAAAACAPRSSAPGAPPRSWDARFPASRSAPPAATRCWPRCRTRPPWWWRRQAPSRSPPAATARCCCSTPGRCSPAPTCAPARRPCVAG